jgi:tetratricopeptide (TPR) repeat protein
MKYQSEFLKDLKEINNKIKIGQLNGIGNALNLFQIYLTKIIALGRFTPENWKEIWRKEVYIFGENFKEIDPVDFLNLIKSAKNGLQKDEKEVLDFFKSEIKVNNQPFEDCINEINSVIAEYPYNPEFRYTLGHFYGRNNEYLKSIEQYEFALKRDKNNSTFQKSLFNNQYDYIKKLVAKNEYKESLKYCDDILDKKTFKSSYVFSNLLVGLKERVKDYLAIEEKIKNAEESFKIIVKNETEKERKRLIEILGFYSAIIAFIFSTVSIAKNFKFEEALIFIICLGIILILFLSIMNILFSSEKLKITAPKFIISIILILSLIFILTKFTIPFWT